MVATAKIVFSQPPGGTRTAGYAVDDGVVGNLVTVTNEDDTDVGVWKLEFLDVPAGPEADCTSAYPLGQFGSGVGAPVSSTFTPDAYHSYLVRLTVDGTIVDESTFSCPDDQGLIRPPNTGEADALKYGGQARSWVHNLDRIHANTRVVSALLYDRTTGGTATKTANYDAVAGDLVQCNASGGTFNVYLPDASANPDAIVEVKKIVSTANAVLVKTKEIGDTVDGGAVDALGGSLDSGRYHSDGGTNWMSLNNVGTSVTGPGSSTATAIARWNGTSGNSLLDSGVTIDASDNVAGAASLSVGAGTVAAAGSVRVENNVVALAAAKAGGGDLELVKTDGANNVLLGMNTNVANLYLDTAVGGAFYMRTGGVTRLAVGDGTVEFGGTVTTPTILQALIASGTAGKTLLIHAQDVTPGGSDVGGDLDIRPGASDTGGTLSLQQGDGSDVLTINDAGMHVTSSTFGYIEIGVAPFANAGLVRLPDLASITGYSSAGTNVTQMLYKEASGVLWVGGSATGDRPAEVKVDPTTSISLRLSGTSKFIVYPTRVELLVSEFRISNTVSAPVILQETHATTPHLMTIHAGDVTTGTGSDLDLQPGSGSVASGVLNLKDGAGVARIAVYGNGAVTVSAQGTFAVNVTGAPAVWVHSAGLEMFKAGVFFADTVSSPSFYQETLAAGDATTLTIHAADASAGAGGDLDIRAGSGSTTHGTLALQDRTGVPRIQISGGGNLALNNIVNAIFQSTTGYAGFGTSRASVGDIRTEAVWELNAKDNAATDDIGVLAIESGTDIVRVGHNIGTNVNRPTHVDLDASTAIRVKNNGQTKVYMDATRLNLNVENFEFGANRPTANIYQETHATDPHTMTIHAGDVTATGAGSDLDIRPGEGIGSGVHGQLSLQDGGATARVIVSEAGNVTLNSATVIYLQVAVGNIELTCREGSVEVGVPIFRFDNTVSLPVISQETHATDPHTMLIHAGDVTATGAGSDLDIRPGEGIGSGTDGQLSLQDGGGVDRVIVEADGDVNLRGAGTVNLIAAGVNQLVAASGTVQLGIVDFRFAASVIGPVIRQADASSGSGTRMTIQSQDAYATGDNDGGDLDIRPGALANGGAHGQLSLQDGGGADRIMVLANGNVTLNSPTQTRFEVGGNITGYFDVNRLKLYTVSLLFNDSVAAPVILQETHATTPHLMTIHAGDVTTGTGSDLDIRPGQSVNDAGHGQLSLQDGGGTDRINILPVGTTVELNVSTLDLTLGANTTIKMADDEVGSVFSLTIQGTDTSGAATGGSVYIDPGTGTSNFGSVHIRGNDGVGGLGTLIETDNVGLGLFGASPIARPTVSGSRDNPEQALANLLTALDSLGAVTDSTTAS